MIKVCEKEKLIEELQKVKHRIQILDMIEERLLKMRELAVKAAEYELSKLERDEIGRSIQQLQQEIMLLEKENTEVQ
ncbi:hypothetical protein [Caloramator proteoclasticus]|mgnify:CR=1 FL=1|uniref:Uncharacterized protein n=1 Tax=Caloramator proteoclasticus DSM 10124 TaxID=1121262 RepID=A0A1M5B3T2_9CLOT|nr:hypothetical protein [Caloramator proteoclasticus]SHF37221.1 hypothetical protein SAMN02746091_02370 [Caloramator proteoclasticus DSM 10124]